jgi:pimeloyl-ACP methyl ester carboxylesterase
VTDTPQTTETAPDAPTPRQRRGLPLVVIIIVVALIAGLITGIIVSRSDSSDTAAPTLTWAPTESGLEETTLSVPMNHEDPDGPTLSIYLLRRPADDPSARIGNMIVNPGGPGFGAEMMLTGAEDYFGADLLARFDIIGMDPRGTGRSTPAIDCIDDYDALLAATDLTPRDDAARAAKISANREYAEACIDRTGEAIAHMTTAATARDIDLVRRALGEDTITYFGTSYGCELGATWATLFPDTVRAAVLDGCADPTADPQDSVRQQAAGFQASVEAFFATCLEVADECPIPHEGDPAAALLALRARVNEDGIPTMPGRPALNPALLRTATIVSMYSQDIWPAFAMGIAMALDGDGSLLLQLADAYYQRAEDGTWPNTLEAFSVISCMDARQTPTPEESAALDRELSVIAPLIYPEGLFSPSLCEELPAPADEPVTITGAGAAPLLVIGNTGDPATPFASTEKMAAALESSVLVAVETNDHGGYGINDCIDEVVHAYLLDLEVPAAGTRC